MKILHTSDWHLGASLYGFDRLREQAETLDRIIATAQSERPDAVLVAGDVFDSSQPSNAAYRLFVDKIQELRDICPEAVIVIISGNHDSASRHELFRTPWEKERIYLVGELGKEGVAKALIPVPGKGTIIALPYVNRRFVPENYIADTVAELAAQAEPGLPVVLMAHLALAGDGYEPGTSIGSLDCVGAAELGDAFDYAALGHIHRTYPVAGASRCAWYSGTPVAVSFDEPEAHGVNIVEIEVRGAEPQVRRVIFTPSRPLVSLPGSGFATFEECKKLAQAFPADIPAYIRLNVCQAEPLPSDAPQQVRAILADRRADFCCMNYRPDISAESAPAHAMAMADFLAVEPREIFRLFLQARGITDTEELTELFNQAQALAEAGKRQ